MSQSNRPRSRSITLQGASFGLGLIGAVMAYLQAVPSLSPTNVITLGIALILVDIIYFLWASEPFWRWLWNNYLDQNRL